ncbi:MAG: HAD family phosphatase [Aestuariivirga sp.]|uniref:HAD family hydrolase n=1 Tax=Aestuariivirga sp. TaxID=2650926 RepID=UPI00301811A7
MNVVFDIGNVLVHWEPRALYRKIFATEGEVEWFIGNVCTQDWNLEQDLGRSFADGVKALSARYPEHAEAITAYDLRWHETVLGAIDGSVQILEELSARGTPLYAITNFNQDKFKETLKRFPFLNVFRDTVVSGDERVIKPDPAIYRLLLQRNGLAAVSCVFIDDSLKNVKGAEAVGMKAIHFTGPEALRVQLTGMGLL